MDAAVSTALCEGIYNSMASGAGGGGFLTIRTANGSVEVMDARELAPAAATEAMFKGAHPPHDAHLASWNESANHTVKKKYWNGHFFV